MTNGINRGAKLLLEGAVMLNESCPECYHPIYRMKNAKLFCANCELPIIRASAKKREDLLKTKEDQMFHKSPIQSKIELLGQELLKETSYPKIKEISEIIKDLEKVRDS